ncbi:MAG: winged helix DNA-binding domain-containing protein, partial [Parafilimonas terrae]|nr:winged helix DNA-binding domain-containing protein [Parafilimonas terrae]
MPAAITSAQARAIFLAAQRLADPGWAAGTPRAVRGAVEHLGYVQIDAINVVERSHHHILFNRMPGYRPGHLRDAQSADRTVFEYWTHALAYVPVADYRYFVPAMRAFGRDPGRRFATVDPAQVRALLRRIKGDGPLSIRDIEDDRLAV